jgi:hypothetical protein
MLKQVGEIGRIAGTLGSGGVREWLHRDGLASNRLMTDAAGSRVQHSHYLPYGDCSGPLTVDENGGPAAPESIGFIGERGDFDVLPLLPCRLAPARIFRRGAPGGGRLRAQVDFRQAVRPVGLWLPRPRPCDGAALVARDGGG